jgi:hypothetical protein
MTADSLKHFAFETLHSELTAKMNFAYSSSLLSLSVSGQSPLTATAWAQPTLALSAVRAFSK